MLCSGLDIHSFESCLNHDEMIYRKVEGKVVTPFENSLEKRGNGTGESPASGV
jgi:hypothetical protein